MKLSISLSELDLAFLDQFAKDSALPSRSAAIQKALRLVRESNLGSSYEEAWSEWETNEDSILWDRTLGDGLNQPFEPPTANAKAA